MPRSKDPKMFTVEGTGHFPLDMLRYDQAWPYGSEDASAITKGYSRDDEGRIKRRKIRLQSHYPPTNARWESFMWRVVDNQF